jgi:hypothetical protein
LPPSEQMDCSAYGAVKEFSAKGKRGIPKFPEARGEVS